VKARDHLTKARLSLDQVGGMVGMGPEYGKLVRGGVERLADLLAGKIT
jgi:hypothetical protein